MNKNMRYWAMCVIAAVVLILITVFTISNNNRKGYTETTVQEDQQHAMDQQETGENGVNNQKLQNDSARQRSEARLDKDNLNRYLHKQDDILSDMMKAMKTIPKTGNASIDFLEAMVPCNEAAIGLAESYLLYGGNDEALAALAEDVILNQDNEIIQFQKLMKKYQSESHVNEDKENAFLDDYDTMLDQDHDIDKSGTQSLEHAFSEGMIAHHKITVELEKSIAEYTDYEEIRTLAENLLANQKEEMEKLSEYVP